MQVKDVNQGDFLEEKGITKVFDLAIRERNPEVRLVNFWDGDGDRGSSSFLDAT